MSRWTVVFFGERRILPTVYLVCQLKGRGRSSLFECELPFDHKTLHLELEDKNFAGVMEGHQNEFKTTKSQEELVEESLANPYGSPSLEELCAGKKDIVIISSDHTRPVPSRVTMPILLHHIHSAAPEARVRILVATGMHRPSTHEELVNKYGEEIVANEEIVMHVATDDSMMKKIGTLPSGGECIINKIAADCDLLLAEGFIEPHFFAGFSGIIVEADEVGFEQITKQLHKLVSVFKISDLTEADAIERELVLFKVLATPERRHEIIEIANVFRAKVVDVGKNTLTVEATGTPSKLDAMEDLFRGYGIRQLTRTGKIAMSRGAHDHDL